MQHRTKDFGDNTYIPIVGIANVDGSNPGSVGVTPTNASGAITTGGSQQTLMAANANRKGLWIQNNSTGDLWINDLGLATLSQPSFKLAAGGYYESPAHGIPVTAISIIGATTGQAFSARQW